MRLASVLEPLSDHHLALAAQCGVDEIVVRYPGSNVAGLMQLKARIESFGMKLGVVEGYLPMERLKLGLPGADEDLSEMKQLLRSMGTAGIRILSYHFMASTDWVRTRVDAPERGGAWVTAFNLAEADRAQVLVAPSAVRRSSSISAAELWANLERMLRELVPVAEECGVSLAMHPDDPPLPSFRGNDGIMGSIESFERLVRLVPSPANGICFCQGTFAAAGVNIPATIRRLGPHIRYVHFRDVRGYAANFVETFHDNGPTDMVAAMVAYRSIGFKGPMRPDHVPQMSGEDVRDPGYGMLGRLFAYGYMRGLMQATARVVPDA